MKSLIPFDTSFHLKHDEKSNATRLTIAEEDGIYWERWRPESGFIIPITWKEKHLNLITEKMMPAKHSGLFHNSFPN